MSKPSLPFMGGKRPEEDSLASWRVDFRDASKLPDLKVVRTDFLMNYGAFGLAVLALCYVGFTEFSHWNMSNEIDELSREIDSRKTQNTKNLADSGEFSACMRYVDQFAGFKRPKLDCLDALVSLGSFNPEGLLISNLTIDAGYLDTRTKKEKVRVQMTGTKEGFTADNVRLVGDSYNRFVKLDLWSKNKAFTMPPPAPPGVRNSDKGIDFTFELFLEAK